MIGRIDRSSATLGIAPAQRRAISAPNRSFLEPDQSRRVSAQLAVSWSPSSAGVGKPAVRKTAESGDPRRTEARRRLHRMPLGLAALVPLDSAKSQSGKPRRGGGPEQVWIHD